MLWLALLLALPCGGQSSSGGGQSSMHPFHNSQSVEQALGSDLNDPLYQQKRLNQMMAAQHKAMVADTDKLLKLVSELNAEIGDKNPSSLTPEQLRKVAEIEKLARGVKDKMRTSVLSGQGYPDVAPLPPLSRY
jgi:hypothetical protein